MGGRVRKLCVDKLVWELAAAASSHISVVINELTQNLNEKPEKPCLTEVRELLARPFSPLKAAEQMMPHANFSQIIMKNN